MSPQRQWTTASVILLFVSVAYFLSQSLLAVPEWQVFRGKPGEDSFRAPRQNLWAELTDEETKEVFDFLHDVPNNLNLTKQPTGSGDENFIGRIELLTPNKTDVLPYLDQKAKPPPRWARVVVALGDQPRSVFADYMVGPLPCSDSTQVMPLIYCYNSGRNTAIVPGPKEGVESWVNSVVQNMSDITADLLGATFNPFDPLGSTLEWFYRKTVEEDGKVVLWVQLYQRGKLSSGHTILPQGIYAKFDISSLDRDGWIASQWFYNDILYGSVEEFRTAWKQPEFVKVLPNLDGQWTNVEDFESNPPGRHKPPPVMIQPRGPRYQIDRQEKYVSWMGFELFLTSSAATGLGLFDIRFRGERIIYELGLQEALAHYAGSDPFQGGLGFLDTVYNMGASLAELVPGHDCPAYADYLSTTYNSVGQSFTTENTICVFEFTADHPLQRHTSNLGVTISRNTYLVVRSVSTVYNYDYTIDYIFYLDGTIEVKFRASGFIFASFYATTSKNSSSDANSRNEYGYRVHTAAATSMHDHVLNFRADFDIAGITKNSVQRVAVEPMIKQYSWDLPEAATARSTMHLVRYPVSHETGLEWPKNGGEMYLIYPNASANAWGEKRAYRIMPGSGISSPAHLTIQNSTTLGRSAAWSSSDLWILRHHDSEPQSASQLNFLTPDEPIVDFEKMLDGESVEEEDIVVYFNLGSHHVPHSGDIPNTLMHTSASSVMFMPFNYFDRDVSRETVSGVRVDVGEEDEAKRARYFGGRYEAGTKLEKDELEPDMARYGKAKATESRQPAQPPFRFAGDFVGKFRAAIQRGKDGDSDEAQVRELE